MTSFKRWLISLAPMVLAENLKDHNCIFKRTHDSIPDQRTSRQVTETEKALFKRIDPIIGHIWKTTYQEKPDEMYDYFLTICGTLDNIKTDHWSDSMTSDEKAVLHGSGFVQAKIGGSASSGQRFWSLGRMADVNIIGGTDWIKLTYRNGSKYNSHCGGQGRRAEVMLMCNPGTKYGKMNISGEERSTGDEGSCYYLIEVETSAVCNAGGGITMFIGKSVKWILIILAVYLAGGWLYNKFVVKNNTIPHVSAFRRGGNCLADLCDKMFRTKVPDNNAIITNGDNPGFGNNAQTEQPRATTTEENDDHLLPM